MGLVAYRDIGDDYVTRTFDLTTDIQDLYANLLELKARGGGDWPESVNEALDVADELDKQMKQRNALNQKLSALVAKRDKFVAEQRDKAPPKASSFDRVVEDTLKAQIKR
jgi:uncharacterized protein YdeI (YjbR/CyaY-like superfamily)